MTTPATSTALPTREQHGIRPHSHTGGAEVPVQTRNQRFRSYDVTDFPEITGREETWRFTPISAFAPLIEAEQDGSRYEVTHPETDGLRVSWIPRDDERVGSAGIPEEYAAAKAWSSFSEALCVEIHGEHEEPITLGRSGLGATPRAAHTVITAAPHSRALLVLENTGEAQIAENVEVIVGDGAHLTVVSLQEWDDTALQLSTHQATVARDATLKHIVVSLGGGHVRLNPAVRLVGSGAEVEALGLYFADAGQYFEHQVFVEHDGPYTVSHVTYKGALQGQGAHTVWIGDVLIGPKAVGTDSYEQNRNLVLTEGTRADSVPNLEIETGDIAGAGHASATGRFDDEQLFYLMSRGLTEEQARRLVVRGFLLEIVQRIGSAELEKHLEEAIEAELAATPVARA